MIPSRRLFNTPLTPELNCFISSPGDFGVVMDPAPGGIYTVDVNIDADGRKTYQFTDFQGRKVLDRRVSTAGFLDTYYCYDNLGQLLYVSPPEMSKKIVRRRNIEFCFLKSDFDRLGYVYTYNDSMLLKSKKLPGCEPVTYRYDGARNLVFSQDGIQRSKNEMAFNLYTPVGGLAVTGICKATVCNGLEQMMAVTTFSETGAEATVDSCGYSWQLPLEGVRLLKVNYYDNYKFTKLAKFDTLRSRAGSDTSRWPGRKGLALGHLTSVLGATGKYDTGVVKYDNEERPVNAITFGHDGLMEEYSTVYSLDGLPLSSSHRVSGEDKQSHENYEFSYDHARRLSQIRLSVDGEGSYILAKNRYDAIGRLVATQTGDLEKESFFNVRGNLTGSRSSYFAETLDYTRNAMEPSFSGNVARYSWENTDMPQQSYDYIYDEADRLINAVHFKKNEELYSANYTYDMNTNITSLVRLGKDSPNTYGVVDELHFTLNGNQTVKVTDMADEVLLENSMDFHDGADADDEMAYDANGRLVRDLNRNITEIEYNDIGMPFRIWIGDILRHQFTYNADGTLLSRTEYNGGTKVWIKPTFPQFPFRSASFGFNTPGLNDQIYTESQNRTLRYAGSQIWENDSCSRIETDFGYIEGDSLCIYCRDFQGNIRAVVSSGTGHVLQTTHYYPYGMPWAEGIGRNANQRKYSGKELYTANGYNTYNFEARHYGGGGLPIFSTPDPLAEIHHDISPYTYCAGNPIARIDPSGMTDLLNKSENKTHYVNDGIAQVVQVSDDEYDQLEAVNFDRHSQIYQDAMRNGTVRTGINPTIPPVIDPEKFVPHNGTEECSDLAKRQNNVPTEGSGSRIDMYNEDTNTFDYVEGIKYIRLELINGHSVVVGVDTGKYAGNANRNTGHFLNIVGMGFVIDSNGPTNYYIYYDNATSSRARGTDNQENRFYRGLFNNRRVLCDKTGIIVGRCKQYVVTEVRRNKQTNK